MDSAQTYTSQPPQATDHALDMYADAVVSPLSSSSVSPTSASPFVPVLAATATGSRSLEVVPSPSRVQQQLQQRPIDHTDDVSQPPLIPTNAASAPIVVSLSSRSPSFNSPRRLRVHHPTQTAPNTNRVETIEQGGKQVHEITPSSHCRSVNDPPFHSMLPPTHSPSLPARPLHHDGINNSHSNAPYGVSPPLVSALSPNNSQMPQTFDGSFIPLAVIADAATYGAPQFDSTDTSKTGSSRDGGPQVVTVILPGVDANGTLRLRTSAAVSHHVDTDSNHTSPSNRVNPQPLAIAAIHNDNNPNLHPIPGNTPSPDSDSSSKFDPSQPYRKQYDTKNVQNKITCGQKIRDVFVSLRFFLLFLLVSSLIIVSVLSWNLTFRAAQDSVSLVSGDYSSVIMAQIRAHFIRRFSAVEHATELNREYFLSGLLSMNNSQAMMNTFRLQTRELVSDTASAITITTKSGQLQGYSYSFSNDGSSAPVFTRWDTTPNFIFTETAVDKNGNSLGIVINEALLSNQTSAPWYQCINVTDPFSVGYTQPYTFYDRWLISQSTPLFDSSSTFLGVMSAGMTLGFIDTVAKQLAVSSTVGTNFFILDSPSGMILGSSLHNFNLSETPENSDQPLGVFLYNGPDLLQAIHKFIRSNSGLSPDVPQWDYRNVPDLHGEFRDGGTDYIITCRTFYHSANPDEEASADTVSWSQQPTHSVQWLFIHVLDRSMIESEINASNTRVLVIVILICTVFIVAMSTLLWTSLRRVASLSDLLVAFAHFEFREHLQDGRLKGRSIFAELRHMQDSVMLMTRAFRKHLEGKYDKGRKYQPSHVQSQMNLNSALLPAAEADKANNELAAEVARNTEEERQFQLQQQQQMQQPLNARRDHAAEHPSNLVGRLSVQSSPAHSPNPNDVEVNTVPLDTRPFPANSDQATRNS